MAEWRFPAIRSTPRIVVPDWRHGSAALVASAGISPHFVYIAGQPTLRGRLRDPSAMRASR